MIEQKISHGNFPISYSHIREAFDFLHNWEERYHFITELGTKIPTYPHNTMASRRFIPLS